MVDKRSKKTFLVALILIEFSQGLICQDSSIRCDEILSISECTEEIYEENCCICGAGTCPGSPWSRLFIHTAACGPSCRNPDVSDGEECPGRYITDCKCWQSDQFFNDEKTRCVMAWDCPSIAPTEPICEDAVAIYTDCARTSSCVPTCKNPRPSCNDCDGAGCECPTRLVLDESTGLCIRFDDCPDIKKCERWYPECSDKSKCKLSASIEGCMNPYTCCGIGETCFTKGEYSLCVDDGNGNGGIPAGLLFGIGGGVGLIICIIVGCCLKAL